MSNELMQVEFNSLSGITVKLDAKTVRDTLTRGNGKVSDQEVAIFLRTCQAKRLDPLENGEVYLIKYDDRTPANTVVGYFAYIRRADHFPDYRGFKAGVCIAFQEGNGYKRDEKGNVVIQQREGAAVYKQIGEVLLGGWCKVFRERKNGKIEETYVSVPLDEYSTGKSNWGAKPATMIRKVAVSQAFRNAFPNEYEGLYTEDEMVASGAIPGGFKVDKETGECIPCIDIDENDLTPVEDEDPIVSKEQRQSLFRTAKTYLGEEASAIIKELCLAEGYESTEKLPVSVYDKILKNVMDIIQERGSVRNTEGEE